MPPLSPLPSLIYGMAHGSWMLLGVLGFQWLFAVTSGLDRRGGEKERDRGCFHMPRKLMSEWGDTERERERAGTEMSLLSHVS